MRLLIMYEVKAMYEAVVCCFVFIGLCVQHVFNRSLGEGRSYAEVRSA